MFISYELTEDDLREVQAQLLVVRREALLSNPRWFLLAMAVVGLLGWPVWVFLTRDDALLSRTPPRLVVFLLALAVVGAIAFTLRTRVAPRRMPGLDVWLARRMARQAARRSVLGPITVTLSEEGLARRNSEAELQVAWSEVEELLWSSSVLTTRLVGQQRVILVPRRAFPDEASATAFRERLELLSGKRCVNVETLTAPPPDTRGTSRRARPLLLAALGLALLLLVLERGLPWYYDPRPGNPPHHVIVYSTGWCPMCEHLRQCLRRHHVPFEERDVEGSPRAEAEWWALEGTGVPVTLVGQRVVYGLDLEALQEALAAAGYSSVVCQSP
jgi:glutaredoxin